ncbi:MAG TPA: GNAT family N-acetyltransferase [Opitutaceae bacterium]|nr:GNAT family N-acetyltransferase [Opitutaceae bacterium]
MSSSTRPPAWLPLLVTDAPAVRALADIAHPGLPERIEVFAERIRLFPSGCLKLVHVGALAAYGIAHPWQLDAPPPIDALLGALPENASCLHLHDVVVAPELRGAGASAAYIDAMVAVARAHRLSALALVSVYGTNRHWSRFGFVERSSSALAAKLASYGATARYLVREL